MAHSVSRFGRSSDRDAAVITNARTGTSRDLRSRERRYAITMTFRVLCFVAMIFVSGPFRWVLLAGAVVLPYVAVLFANQADQTGQSSAVVPGAPANAPQLTVGPDLGLISGTVEDVGSVVGEHEDRVA